MDELRVFQYFRTFVKKIKHDYVKLSWDPANSNSKIDRIGPHVTIPAVE